MGEVSTVKKRGQEKWPSRPDYLSLLCFQHMQQRRLLFFHKSTEEWGI
jgi:hypothetical protein